MAVTDHRRSCGPTGSLLISDEQTSARRADKSSVRVPDFELTHYQGSEESANVCLGPHLPQPRTGGF